MVEGKKAKATHILLGINTTTEGHRDADPLVKQLLLPRQQREAANSKSRNLLARSLVCTQAQRGRQLPFRLSANDPAKISVTIVLNPHAFVFLLLLLFP